MESQEGGWLDPRTGEVWPDPSMSGGSVEEHWLRVEPVAPHEAWEEREALALSVQDRGMRDSLLHALEGRGAFSRFRRVLDREPALLEAWFRFHDARSQERAIEWLADHGTDGAPDEEAPKSLSAANDRR